MIPTFSSEPKIGAWREKVRAVSNPLVDYELAGVALGDTSEGFLSYQWVGAYEDGNIVCYREDTAVRSTVLSRAGVLRVALAFDQTMRPYTAFTDATGSWLWYYSAAAGSMQLMSLGSVAGVCLCLDDKRPNHISESDLIVSYTVGNEVRCRVQREAFSTERVLGTLPGALALTAFGMNKNLRLQWRF